MIKRFQKVFLVLLSVFLFSGTLTGCGQVKTQIAYTVYPVGYLARRIAGDTVNVESVQEDMIVQRATLKSDYIDILERSGVFVYIGTLEPYLTTNRTTITDSVDEMMDLSIMNAVYSFQRYTAVTANGQTTYVESPYYEGSAFDWVDTDERDLYLWTDPIAMLSMARDIKDWLVETLPDNASIYEENFESLENDLINLDAEYQSLATSTSSSQKMIRFVSLTASFGNWQKTYGIEVYPVILSKYGVLPNESQLQIIEETIQRDGVKYIVYEPNMTDDMIELFNRVQEDLNLTRVELNNLSSLTQEENDEGKDYLSLMYENLSVLESMVEDRPGIDTTVQTEENDAESTID